MRVVRWRHHLRVGVKVGGLVRRSQKSSQGHVQDLCNLGNPVDAGTAVEAQHIVELRSRDTGEVGHAIERHAQSGCASPDIVGEDGSNERSWVRGIEAAGLH